MLKFIYNLDWTEDDVLLFEDQQGLSDENNGEMYYDANNKFDVNNEGLYSDS